MKETDIGAVVLVTGARGFIGRALVERLAGSTGTAASTRVRAAVRGPGALWPSGVEEVLSPELSSSADWSGVLKGVGAVIHTAARVHRMKESGSESLAAYRSVNAEGTIKLAEQAANAGVRRFVFVSSIKVNGERTQPGKPFTPDDEPHPVDPYGISKHEAEVGLRQVSRDTGLEVTIVRPVLTYGPGVRANFLSMMRWIERGVPLPFGSINNKRSLVARDNLVDLLTVCASHPLAANQTFLVSDGEDVSTPELIRRLAKAMGRPARLISVPGVAMELAAALVGKRDVARRLFESLQVDIGKTRRILDWNPPVGMNEALAETAADFVIARSDRHTAPRGLD